MRIEVSKAILLFLIVFLSWQILYLTASAYPSLYDNWLLAYLAILPVISCFFAIDRQGAQYLGLRRTGFWKRIVIIGLILAAVYQLYWIVLGGPIFSTMPVRFASHGILSIPYNFSLAITVGFVEETVFRGYILRNLSRVYSDAKAIIYSSILFGVYHISPVLALTSTTTALDTVAYWTLYALAAVLVGLFLGLFYMSSQKTTVGTITYHSFSIFFESLVPFTLATSLIVGHLLSTTVYFLFVPIMIALNRRHVI